MAPSGLTGPDAEDTDLFTTMQRKYAGSDFVHQAAKCGDTSAVEVFLRHGADLAVRDHRGRTALDIAIVNGQKSTVCLLSAQQPRDGCGLLQIDLAGKDVTAEEAVSVALAVRGMQCDFSLNLASNKELGVNGYGTATPEGPLAIASIAQESHFLRALDVSDIELGLVGATAFATALRTTTSLAQLNIATARLTGRSSDRNCGQLGGVLELSGALAANTSLAELTFSGDGEEASSGPTSTAVTLTATTMSAAVSGASLLASGTILLSGFLPKCQSLTALDISQNCIPASGARALAAALLALPPSRLSALDVSRNRFGVDGARLLAGALRRQLEASGEAGSGSGSGSGAGCAVTFGDSRPVTMQCGMTAAHFGGKGLRASGAVLVGAMMLAPCIAQSLTVLDLSNNGIGGYDEGGFGLVPTPEGPAALAEALGTAFALYCAAADAGGAVGVAGPSATSGAGAGAAGRAGSCAAGGGGGGGEGGAAAAAAAGGGPASDADAVFQKPFFGSKCKRCKRDKVHHVRRHQGALTSVDLTGNALDKEALRRVKQLGAENANVALAV